MQTSDSPVETIIENQSDRDSLMVFHSLVGTSLEILRVRQFITQVADSDVNVLLLGPSGSGKEVVARNIHYQSTRNKAPFIAINCGAIPSDLLESELFGHEKGAFTSAYNARLGRFELANQGTLFLDEIGDMPLQMQVKLLRVLQERCFERVGGNKRIEVNVRIIAATHRNLEKGILSGSFREDLYYRLNVFPIEVPALKDRIGDLPLLIEDILAKIASDGRQTMQLDAEALAILSRYRWPGNVRELANVIERLCIMHPNESVGVKQLPLKFTQSVKQSNPDFELEAPIQQEISQQKEALFSFTSVLLPEAGIDLKKYLIELEKNLIQQAIARAKGVVAHAANMLRLRRTTLIEKMKKYGLVRTNVITDVLPKEEEG